MKRRIIFILILFFMFAALLLSRVYFLSIKSNTYYTKLAQQNLVKTEHLVSTRGIITDRNHQDIAINNLGFSLSLSPHLSAKDIQKSLNFITHELPDFDTQTLFKRYKKSESPYNHKPIMIIPFIPYDDLIAKFILFTNNKYFQISPTSKRFYPQGSLMAHIVGYVSRANIQESKESEVSTFLGLSGKDGIEKYYNSLLEGTLGERKYKVTALNKSIGILYEKIPHASNIQLSIDIRVQAYLKKVFDGKSGAILVMNAQDGSILAAGSYPEFDNNLFVQGISKEQWAIMIKDLKHPFSNKFLHGLYPPGSSTKPQMLLSFLSSNHMSAKEKLSCSGTLNLGKRKFRCWNHAGHGMVDGKRALRESCDIYFYKGALREGIDKISTDLKAFGFGHKTGIDLPSEFIGTVPNRNWKINKFGESWYKGETLNTVIGQGDFLVTPLQVATATALIATGKQVVPHFLKKINDTNVTYTRADILTVAQKEHLQTIQQGMYSVCNHKRGTAFRYNHAWVTMAGKTGTSQVVGIPQEEMKRMSEDDLHYFKKSHAWFTTYAPYQNPRYVITAIVEHGGHGGKAAGEMVSDVYNYLVKLGYISKKYVHKSALHLIDSNQTRP